MPVRKLARLPEQINDHQEVGEIKTFEVETSATNSRFAFSHISVTELYKVDITELHNDRSSNV